MKIYVTSIMVDSQEKACQFYTEKLFAGEKPYFFGLRKRSFIQKNSSYGVAPT